MASLISSPFLSLPVDILTLLPSYLTNIEDYMNLSSTCRGLRKCLSSATPNQILHLAAAQSRTFFRPDPHFLVSATARELGNWARRSDENERELWERMGKGINGLMELALEHCGITMERIRELHLLRFSIINPVTDIIDQCVGQQWYAAENFWDGGRSDAYTISSDPSVTFFHLAIYGELFAPDFESILHTNNKARRLSPDTRIEYIKYCVPDWACIRNDGWQKAVSQRGLDPRRAVNMTGPYADVSEDPSYRGYENHNIALTWVIKSSRWRPRWEAARATAGLDFSDANLDWWWTHDEEEPSGYWRQRLWENICVCQGLEGLGMIRADHHGQWVERLREWRRKIEAMEKEPEIIDVASQTTHSYPFLLGDLRICVSGYVPGTMLYSGRRRSWDFPRVVSDNDESEEDDDDEEETTS